MTTTVRQWKAGIGFVVLLLLLQCCCLNVGGATPQRGKLIVEIKGVHPDKGPVRCSLWRTADGFLKGRSYRHASVDASGEVVRVEFGDLEPGQYAVSAYEDENNNGILDTGFMSKPKEPYGFSNDARGTFGPPSFRAAAFDVNGETRTSFQLK